MAALHFARTQIINISKANIPCLTSLSFTQKPSRVGFTSASKHSQGRHASEETNNPYDGDEAIGFSGGTKSEHARNKMEQGKERMKEGAGEMKDVPMDGMKEANEKVKEKVSEMRDRTGEMKNKAKETAKAAKDKTMDAAGVVADKTKQTVAGAWDAATGTSKKIKESVVGTSSSDDDDDDWGDDRIGKPKVSEEDAANLRRKVGNLDHEKQDY